MNEPVATLEYARIDNDAENLRGTFRRLAGWAIIVYGTAQIGGTFASFYPQIASLGSTLSGVGSAEGMILLGILLVFGLSYPLMIVAGAMLLANKPRTTLLLRIATAVIVLGMLASSIFTAFSFRRSGMGSEYWIGQCFRAISGVVFPLLMALLPLQRRQ